MEHAFRHVFLHLIAEDTLDYASANALARSCLAAARSWRRVVRHEVADQTAALYRGLALRSCAIGLHAFAPLSTKLQNLMDEQRLSLEDEVEQEELPRANGSGGVMATGTAATAVASSSSSSSFSHQPAHMHPSRWFHLPPPPLDAALASDEHCIGVSVAYGFAFSRNERILLQAAGLLSSAAGARLARLRAARSAPPSGIICQPDEFLQSLHDLLLNASIRLGHDVLEAAFLERFALPNVPHAEPAPGPERIFPIPVAMLDLFARPSDGEPLHGPRIAEAVAQACRIDDDGADDGADGGADGGRLSSHELPHIARKAALLGEAEQAADEQLGRPQPQRLRMTPRLQAVQTLCEAFCVLLHGFSHTSDWQRQALPCRPICNESEMPGLAQARRYAAYAGPARYAEQAAGVRGKGLKSAQQTFFRLAAFRHGTVTRPQDRFTSGWMRTYLGPINEHAGMRQVWASLLHWTIAQQQQQQQQQQPAVRPVTPCVEIVTPYELPAGDAHGVRLPRLRIVLGQQTSNSFSIYAFECARLVAVVHRRSGEYVISWSNAAFSLSAPCLRAVDAKAGGTSLRCGIIAAIDSGTLSRFIANAVPAWRFACRLPQPCRQVQPQKMGRTKLQGRRIQRLLAKRLAHAAAGD